MEAHPHTLEARVRKDGAPPDRGRRGAAVRGALTLVMELSRRPRGLENAPTLQIALACNPEAPWQARAAVVGLFGSEISRSTLGTLTLLVSELVSNSVAHSGASPSSKILLRVVLLERGALRVEVTDRGRGFAPTPRDRNRQGGGYGLYLVDREATCWGVDPQDATRVWFEMPSGADE